MRGGCRERGGPLRRGLPARAPPGGGRAVSEVYEELARLGSATVYEASGREGLIDPRCSRSCPGRAAAGPARTVRCGQNDNLMVHAAMAHARPATCSCSRCPSPSRSRWSAICSPPRPGARARRRCSSTRRCATSRSCASWACRSGRAGSACAAPQGRRRRDRRAGRGGRRGDPAGRRIVLDADGAVVVARERIDEVLGRRASARGAEAEKRARLQDGALSYDLDGLRERRGGRA